MKAFFPLAILWLLIGCDGAPQHEQAANSSSSPCYLEHGCVSTGSPGAPTVYIEPGVIRAETPFTVRVEFDQSVNEVKARIEGVSMFMGYIPVILSPTASGYEASTMVGACTTDAMTWRLLVSWAADEQSHQAFVNFTVTD